MSGPERSTVMDAQMGMTSHLERLAQIDKDYHFSHESQYAGLYNQLAEKNKEIQALKTIIARQRIQIDDLFTSIRRLKKGQRELDIHRHL